MSNQISVLVVDDDQTACRLLREVMAKEGYQVEAAESGREAVEKAETALFDVAISDIRMPDLDGLELLKILKRLSPETIVIMMTAFGSIETAIEAIKEGAYDYISKPFKLDEVKLTVRRALDHKRLLRENIQYRQALKERYQLENIVGRSALMLEVYKIIARVASGSSTVLIQGESGTGKELIARAIHYNSPRADHPFVVLDCAALAETLLDSELFGHVRGAFTGAVENKKGLLEEADGGTCFLDELGNVSPAVQAKLLRFLQEREIKRVGGTEAIKLDVRVIAATNQQLEALVKAGTFREDLYYRLSVVSMTLPPLRERKEDIPLLTEHFLRRYALQNTKDISHVSPEALTLLGEHDWPGNIRELEHVIERAVALTGSPVLLPHDLPPNFRKEAGEKVHEGGPLTLDEMEKQHIQGVLKSAGGNKKRAAELLGIHRRTLYRLAKRYQIDLGADSK
jgi:two-component system response regulator AtoC